jgi:hypothetical protein
MMRQQEGQQIAEDVNAGNRFALFHQQGLQEFFGSLLAMEAQLIMKWLASAGQLDGQSIIGLGLSQPLGRHFFHTVPCPS